MSQYEIRQKLIGILCVLFPEAGIDIDVLEYVDLIDDLGMDSITFISIVVEVEDVFSITVPDDFLLMDNFRNVDNIVQIIEDVQNSENYKENEQEK